jgi:O-antigen ligase
MFFRGKWTGIKTVWTLKWYLGLIPIVCGFILSNTTNGVIAVSIVTCIYLIIVFLGKYKAKKTMIISLCVTVFLSVIIGYAKFIHLGAYSQRIEANIASIELIKEKPLLGWGIGQSYYVVPVFLNGEKLKKEIVQYSVNSIYYRNDFVKTYKEKHNFNSTIVGYWPQLHNDPLQWIVDTGVIGLALFLFIIIGHALSAFKLNNFPVIPFLVFMAALITSCAFFTFQIGCFLFITVLMMGFIQGEYVSQRSPH